jgi:pyridoxine 5-phosphate synthase
VRAAHRSGARQIEFHTGPYCHARGDAALRAEYEKLCRAAERAREEGLVVNAGHGLNYHNVRPVAAIEGMRELNIGHAIVSRAVFHGLHAAVAEMAALIDAATRHPGTYRLD